MEKKSIWAEMQEELNSLPEEERARLRAESRERALMEERAALHFAEARGRAGALREAVEKMVASGISEIQARPILDLSPDE